MDSETASEIFEDLPPEDPEIENKVGLILAGRVVVQSYDGTSQPGVLLSFNVVKGIFALERLGYTGDELVRRMLSKELVEEAAAICSISNLPDKMGPENLLQIPYFSRALRQVDAITGEPRYLQFMTLLRRLGSLAQAGAIAAAVVSSSDYTIAILAIHTGPKDPSTFVIFDPLTRPRNGTPGTSLSFFPSAQHTADYLDRLLSPDLVILSDTKTQSFSAQFFVAGDYMPQALDAEVFKAEIAALEVKSALEEVKNEIAVMQKRQAKVTAESLELRDEVAILREQLQTTTERIRRVQEQRDGAVLQAGSKKGKEKAATPFMGYITPPPSRHGSTFGKPEVDIQAQQASQNQLLREAHLARQRQRQATIEVKATPKAAPIPASASLQKPASVPTPASVARRFDCKICFQKCAEDALAPLPGCEHQFCRDCLKKYVTASLEMKNVPIGCPLCGSEDEADNKGSVTQEVMENIGVSETEFILWINLLADRADRPAQVTACKVAKSDRAGPSSSSYREEMKKEVLIKEAKRETEAPPKPEENILMMTEELEDASAEEIRALAREEGDSMGSSFEAMRTAKASGEREVANFYREDAYAHKAKMEAYHQLASAKMLQKYNPDSSNKSRVNLHGQFVSEAVAIARTAIKEAQAQCLPYVRFIVGRGLHSEGEAKIGPAIESLTIEERLRAAYEPHNVGVLVVFLDPATSKVSRDLSPNRAVFSLEGLHI